MFAVKSLATTAVVCFVTLCFEHAEHFHISHSDTLWGIIL